MTDIPAASETYYTIQTATYTPASLAYANRHFNSVSALLEEDERSYLRIERTEGYIVIRIGKIADHKDAVKILEKVKGIASDAFILKISDIADANVIKSYEKAGISGEKNVAALPLSLSSKKDAAKPESLPEEYYTLQIGNFPKLEDATDKFNVLFLKLEEDDIKDLRIEKTGRYFSVRLGRFSSYSSAKTLFVKISALAPQAAIMKGKKTEEHVISSYEKTSLPPVVSIEHSGASSKSMDGGEEAGKKEAEKQRKEFELLLQNVSAQYSSESYGKAAELLRKGIEKWPGNPELYAWYGATLLNMQYSETALKQYRKAVEIAPDVSDYHAGVGISLLNIYMERAMESVEAFNKALQIDPNNIPALEGLGFVYASIGKKDLALELYNRLEPLDKAAAHRLYLAITQEIRWESK